MSNLLAQAYLIERYGLRQVHRHGHVAELLFTFGIAYMIEELVQMVWGKVPVDYRLPEALNFCVGSWPRISQQDRLRSSELQSSL